MSSDETFRFQCVRGDTTLTLETTKHSITELLEVFESFLQACEFSLKGRVEIVEDVDRYSTERAERGRSDRKTK